MFIGAWCCLFVTSDLFVYVMNTRQVPQHVAAQYTSCCPCLCHEYKTCTSACRCSVHKLLSVFMSWIQDMYLSMSLLSTQAAVHQTLYMLHKTMTMLTNTVCLAKSFRNIIQAWSPNCCRVAGLFIVFSSHCGNISSSSFVEQNYSAYYAIKKVDIVLIVRFGIETVT